MGSEPEGAGAEAGAGPGAGPAAAAEGPAKAGAGKRGFFAKLALVGDAVIFRHTLFSLPFALAAVLIESGGRPDPWKLLLIVAAAASGRNLANALNRIVDRGIDARNPRTAGRHLPSGKLEVRDLVLFSAAMGAILLAAAAALGWLCLALLPLAGVAVFGYSYTKRWTWLCHFWLGATCAIAPMGALVALSGRLFVLRYFVLSGAVALWIAGFDIIYAIQDIEVDRREGLRSLPARFGAGAARFAAALCHLGTAAGLALLPAFWPLGAAYWVGFAAAAALLVAEHLVARGGTERHVRIAAYGINEVIPLVLLAAVALDVFLL
ncbi:MAG: UbiA family prenyltransferase [Spirochaetaceae bacterium]|nr:UbiA family prenyltransferase [Spirochaetaceae bacterium]